MCLSLHESGNRDREYLLMILEHGRIKRGRERRVLNEGLPCIERSVVVDGFCSEFYSMGLLTQREP